MTSLKQELGRTVTPEEVADALHPAFERVLSISLEPAALNEEEAASATRLAAEKYGADAWTLRT
jgi:lipoate-protein ligase A